MSKSAGNLQTGSISSAGGASGHGGHIVLNAAGNILTTTGSTFNTSGGAPAVGASIQGTDAGNLTITGATLTMTAPGAIAINANGGNARRWPTPAAAMPGRSR